jgi:hypothetical protein
VFYRVLSIPQKLYLKKVFVTPYEDILGNGGDNLVVIHRLRRSLRSYRVAPYYSIAVSIYEKILWRFGYTVLTHSIFRLMVGAAGYQY